MGAIYIESNLDTVKDIILKLLESGYETINLDNLFSDYKTALQEVTQAKFGMIPIYKLEQATGPDHKKEFEISIWIDDRCYGKAKGKSKKIAQQAIAKIALDKISNEKN